MGLSLTVTLGVVIALTSIAAICVATRCGSRANQYKSKDGAGGDEDAEVHVVSAENQEKGMSDDPYEVNIEMRTMIASKINSNKEDEDVAEPEHESESEPKAEAPTTEDSQKAVLRRTVSVGAAALIAKAAVPTPIVIPRAVTPPATPAPASPAPSPPVTAEAAALIAEACEITVDINA